MTHYDHCTIRTGSECDCSEDDIPWDDLPQFVARKPDRLDEPYKSIIIAALSVIASAAFGTAIAIGFLLWRAEWVQL